MRAEILTIGSELICGATLNTNVAYLSRRLSELGIICQRQVTVSDERSYIIECIHEAIRRCDFLLITGGIGPTFDDVTVEAISEATSRKLVYFPKVARQIRRFYSRHNRALRHAALRQAYLPKGGLALSNNIGTAAGLWLKLPSSLIIALPGVPREMRAIMEQSVIARLKEITGTHATAGCTLRTVGILELSIEAILRRMRLPKTVQVGLYPNLRTVDVRLAISQASSFSKARKTISGCEARLRRALGAAVYATGDETLEEAVGKLLIKKRRTVAIAESCTGGLISDMITDIPGSSRYFMGSLIAYHNNLKQNQLGVPKKMLRRFGAVSSQVAKAMAQGMRSLAHSDIGVSVTGIAGPKGATPKKPLGLVYFALADGRRVESMRYQFVGDRSAIKMQAAQSALDLLRRFLTKI